jgi:hypothetical protein
MSEHLWIIPEDIPLFNRLIRTGSAQFVGSVSSEQKQRNAFGGSLNHCWKRISDCRSRRANKNPGLTSGSSITQSSERQTTFVKMLNDFDFAMTRHCQRQRSTSRTRGNEEVIQALTVTVFDDTGGPCVVIQAFAPELCDNLTVNVFVAKKLHQTQIGQSLLMTEYVHEILNLIFQFAPFLPRFRATHDASS